MNEIQQHIEKFKKGIITKEEAKRRLGLLEYEAEMLVEKTRRLLQPFVSKMSVTLESARRFASGKGRVAYLSGHAKKIRTQKKNTHRLMREVEKEMVGEHDV